MGVLEQAERIRKTKRTWLFGVFITNGCVAWQIRDGRLSELYDKGFYLPSAGWYVTDRLSDSWYPGQFGEYRRDDAERN